jgi:hypothetical protein
MIGTINARIKHVVTITVERVDDAMDRSSGIVSTESLLISRGVGEKVENL